MICFPWVFIRYAHVFTYGIELTKLFSDGQGNFANVEFIVHNDTDNYFVIAELNEDEGMLIAALGYVLYRIYRNYKKRRKGGRYVRKKEPRCR